MMITIHNEFMAFLSISTGFFWGVLLGCLLVRIEYWIDRKIWMRKAIKNIYSDQK